MPGSAKSAKHREGAQLLLAGQISVLFHVRVANDLR
jgi:hypothetical protein